MSINIVQFGAGNFLRAYMEWMLHELQKKGLGTYEIGIVKREYGSTLECFLKQNGEYHLSLVGMLNGKKHETLEKITVLKEFIYGNELEKLKDFAICEHLKMVVSNTTEAGIAIQNEDSIDMPLSYPARLLYLLYNRYTHFKNKNALEGKELLIFPCELIEDNGTQLKTLMILLSEQWSLPNDFIDWMTTQNSFFNNLVDRIVPGFPKDTIKEYDAQLGFRDDMLVQAEEYYFLAVEGNCEKLEKFLPLQKAGFNVVYTDKLHIYRDRKVKILNGLHTSIVPIGLLLNLHTVREAVLECNVAKFIEDILEYEIIDQINLERKEVKDYAKAILLRFKNPCIKHNLKDILLNSTTKIKSRIFPIMVLYIKKKKTLPSRCMFVLTLYSILFQEEHYPIKENQELIDFYHKLQRQRKNNIISVSEYLNIFFNNNPVWKNTEEAKFIFSQPGFLKEIETMYNKIKNIGTVDCLRELKA